MKFRKSLATSLLISIAPVAAAQAPENAQPATTETPVATVDKSKAAPIESFYMEYLDYEQRIHSTSENTELGEKTRLDAAFKYRFTEDTNIRLRLDIDPYKYPEENKSSRFEVRLYHKYEAFEVQADLDINGNDSQGTGDDSRGATTIGPDEDSDDSFLAYQPTNSVKAIFYPYNFGGEVGNEFRTLDVTRIYHIEGNPSVINEIPTADESLRTRTVPGFELQFFPVDSLMVYAGVGSVGFNYPGSDNFDIRNQTSAEFWKIKEDRAYKGGLRFANASSKVVVEHVSHTNAKFTGSLLQKATSIQLQHKFAGLILDLEHADHKAGSRPYQLNKDWTWFSNDNGYNPVFVDAFRNEQSWIGQHGSASMLKVGYDLGAVIPFVAAKKFDRNFIYRKLESAEKLRTADGTDSHGGLQSWKLGAEIKAGKFVIRPEAEHFLAKNAVYSNRGEQREYNLNNQSFGKKNTVFTLFTTYQY